MRILVRHFTDLRQHAAQVLIVIPSEEWHSKPAERYSRAKPFAQKSVKYRIKFDS